MTDQDKNSPATPVQAPAGQPAMPEVEPAPANESPAKDPVGQPLKN
jgi:hypothetical protein